jgi:hypothetical protein
MRRRPRCWRWRGIAELKISNPFPSSAESATNLEGRRHRGCRVGGGRFAVVVTAAAALLAVCSGWLVVFAMRSLRRDSIHISGIAVTLTSKPGHEKSCPAASTNPIRPPPRRRRRARTAARRRCVWRCVALDRAIGGPSGANPCFETMSSVSCGSGRGEENVSRRGASARMALSPVRGRPSFFMLIIAIVDGEEATE